MTFSVSKLPQGLHVLTYNMPNVNSVAINLIVGVGSRFEELPEHGISHFLEHMAFKGTFTRSARDIAEEFDAIGGYFNAYTGHEQTVYYTKVLPENCYKALSIIADIIQNSSFDEAEIKKEYQVILQEIAQTQDTPEDFIAEKFYNKAFENQPLGRSILGEAEILAKFDGSYFKHYVSKHYNSENIYLSIAGNISHEEVVKYVEDLFSSLCKGEKNNCTPAKYSGGYSAIQKDLEQTTILLGFESIPYLNIEQFYHIQVLSLILGGGMSSRLFQQIRENLGLVYSIGSYNVGYCDSGVFSIYAATHHDKIEVLQTQLTSEIKKIIDKVEILEIDRAKTQLKTNIYMAQEKSAYKSEEIGKNYAIFGKYISVEEIIEYIMNITAQNITDMAGKILLTKPTLAIIGPKPQLIDYQKLCVDLLS